MLIMADDEDDDPVSVAEDDDDDDPSDAIRHGRRAARRRRRRSAAAARDGRRRGRKPGDLRRRTVVVLAALSAAVLSFRQDSLAIRLTSQVDSGDYAEDDELEESKCSYEGSIKTDRNWFGFLANATVMDTSHLMFEFKFPAEKCCPNILFYTEEQISVISTRINCWQKEELLHPEVDQILSLTPSFPWSGCRLTRAAGVNTYVCKSGRSLTTSSNEYPLALYVAVSNCAVMYGLELTYRLEIHGQVLACPSTTPPIETTEELPRMTMMPSLKAASLIPRQAEQSFPANDKTVCIINGEVNTTQNWAGFLHNFSFLQDGGFRYEISYPYDMYIQNIILYEEDQVLQLSGEQNCWKKQSIIPAPQVPDSIIQLSFRADGCISKVQSYGERNITCTGERRFDKPQKVFLAASNCWSTIGLLINYKLSVFGFANKDLCREDKNHTPSLHSQFRFLTCFTLLLWIFSLLHKSA